MAGKEFWTRPKVEQLCNLWKTKPSLYNLDHEYHDRWQKRRDSEEIAQHLGTTVEELLKKMKNLRSQYARERRKTRFSPNDNCQVSSSKWYLLSVLRFLDKSGSLSSIAEVSSEVAESKFHQSDVATEAKAELPNQPKNGNNAGEVTEKRMRLSTEERTDVVKVIEPPSEDAFDIFGKFVASELRQMENAQAQKLARLRIQQVLVDVQLGSAVLAPPHTE